jgi:alkaline phosphatase
MTDTIAEQVIHSGTDIILSGGELLLLPQGVIGRHGKRGTREDNRNLIKEAKNLGYTVVYTRDELLGLPSQTEKVLGVFSAGHTFNDQTEEDLEAHGLPLYNRDVPTVAEMTQVALNILSNKRKEFFVVIEEEGSDNFANRNNAKGALEALRRADGAIGVALDYVQKNPNTLLITAADSNAGGMQVVSIRDSEEVEKPLSQSTSNGAPLDGIGGRGTLPFVAAPDQFGNRLRFGIAWSCFDDVAGSVIAKAHGLNSEVLPDNVDNTTIYRIMYATLFGIQLPQ